MYVRVQSSLLSFSLGPISYMRTEAPYLLGYSEPLYFSGSTPAPVRHSDRAQILRDNPEFRKAMLMLRPDLDIPHRTYIRTHLTSLYESVQSQLLSDLPETAKVSIALDGWQSPFKRSFLAITAYYITTDWQWQEVRYILL